MLTPRCHSVYKHSWKFLHHSTQYPTLQLTHLAAELAAPAQQAASAAMAVRWEALGLPAPSAVPTRRSSRAGAAETQAKLAQQSRAAHQGSNGDSGSGGSSSSSGFEEAGGGAREADYDFLGEGLQLHPYGFSGFRGTLMTGAAAPSAEVGEL